jgi:hypothetical protein
MDVAVHDTRHDRVAFGIDGPVGRGVGGGVQLGDPAVLDQKRRHRADGIGDIAGEEFADIRDQCPRHGPSLFSSSALRYIRFSRATNPG